MRHVSLCAKDCIDKARKVVAFETPSDEFDDLVLRITGKISPWS